MSSKQNKRCPRKAGKSCNKIMPNWDDHDICRTCWNFSCSRSSVCNTYAVWTDDMRNKFDKCIMRSDRAKSSRAQSKKASAPIVIPCQVPENGPDRETLLLLPSVSQSRLLALGMRFCLNMNLILILFLRLLLRPWFLEA